MRPSDRFSLTTTVRRHSCQQGHWQRSCQAACCVFYSRAASCIAASALLAGSSPFLPCTCSLSFSTLPTLCITVYRPCALADGGSGERGAAAARCGQGWRASVTVQNQQSRQRLCGWRHQAITASPESEQTTVSPHCQCTPCCIACCRQRKIQALVHAAAWPMSARVHVFTWCAMVLQMERQHCAAAEPGLDAGGACDSAGLRPWLQPLPRRLGIEYTAVRSVVHIGADVCVMCH